jgi:hypothetical protein
MIPGGRDRRSGMMTGKSSSDIAKDGAAYTTMVSMFSVARLLAVETLETTRIYVDPN